MCRGSAEQSAKSFSELVLLPVRSSQASTCQERPSLAEVWRLDRLLLYHWRLLRKRQIVSDSSIIRLKARLIRSLSSTMRIDFGITPPFEVTAKKLESTRWKNLYGSVRPSRSQVLSGSCCRPGHARKEYDWAVSLAHLCQPPKIQGSPMRNLMIHRKGRAMSRLSKSTNNKSPSGFTKDAIAGQSVRNKLLLGLPKSERDILFPTLSFLTLPLGTNLSEKNAIIKFGYFLNDGLASVLNVMKSEKTIEVGLGGREGFIGLPLTVGFKTSPAQVIMQVAGSGFRISAADLVIVLRRCPNLSMALARFSHEMGLQAAQVAACNRLHEMDERLARWLLMSQDRLDGNVVPLTQDYLSHMLGTRRASVTVAAGMLQKAGLITYKRGAVTIEDRTRLEEACCECYGVLNSQIRKWQSEAN